MGSTIAECPTAEVRRLRAVLDAASDAYLCADGSAVVKDCNAAAERQFGYSRHELVGADLLELLAPTGSLDDYRAMYQRSLAAGGTTAPVEVAVVRSDGVEAQVEFSAWVTEDDDGPTLHALYRDVTERRRLQEELAESARRLAEAQALARTGSWEWDVATDEVVWSAALYSLFGIDEGTPVTYTTFLDRLLPDDRAWVVPLIDAAGMEGKLLAYEARIERTDGQVRWIAAYGDVVVDGHGVPTRVLGTASDITDRKVAELELERLAVTDALTGLANRSLFDTRLEAALASCHPAEPVALLLLDLDRFKPVNDVHGHPVGDAVLSEVSTRLAECIRPGDTLARIGGDEFALVLPGARPSDATRIAQRLVETTSAPIATTGSTTLRVGASVGIAVCDTPATGVGALRRQADRALYTAKRSGRGQHVLFTSELEPSGTESLTVRSTEARAWAAYMTALRADIARRKDEGALSRTSRAPTSVARTLDLLLAAIEDLPHHTEAVELPLPERVQLEEFVFHQSMVDDWVDRLADRGVLSSARSPRATAFWIQLQDQTSFTT